MKGSRAFLGVLGLMPWVLKADHGQSLFIVQDTEVPALWNGHFWSNASWEKYDSVDELSIEPGLSLGITSWAALGVTGRFADEGDGWKYSSISPHIQIRITPADWPVRVGFLAGYSWGENDEFISNYTYRDVVVTTNRQPQKQCSVRRTPVITSDPAPTSPGDETEEEPVQCGPEFGPDAPPCPLKSTKTSGPGGLSRPGVVPRHSGHNHQGEEPPTAKPAPTNQTVRSSGSNRKQSTETTSKIIRRKYRQEIPENGIHLHGREHFFARLMIEGEVTDKDSVFFNLINVVPRYGQTAWGYAVGYRHTFSSAWAAGIESTGDFGSANEHRGLLGIYWRPRHDFLFKLGGGVGFTSESANLTVQTGLVWNF